MRLKKLNKNFASGQGYPRCKHRGIYARPRTPAQRAAAKFQYNDASIGEFTPLWLKRIEDWHIVRNIYWYDSISLWKHIRFLKKRIWLQELLLLEQIQFLNLWKNGNGWNNEKSLILAYHRDFYIVSDHCHCDLSETGGTVSVPFVQTGWWLYADHGYQNRNHCRFA